MSKKYIPTPLPAKLDLQKPNTGQQLSASAGTSLKVSIVTKAGDIKTKQKQFQDDINQSCMNIITEHLAQFLRKYHQLVDLNVCEDPSSMFEQWVRNFHSEYDDVWFSDNRQRLFRSFKPIWDDHFKAGRSGTELGDVLVMGNRPSKGSTDLLIDFGDERISKHPSLPNLLE